MCGLNLNKRLQEKSFLQLFIPDVFLVSNDYIELFLFKVHLRFFQVILSHISTCIF